MNWAVPQWQWKECRQWRTWLRQHEGQIQNVYQEQFQLPPPESAQCRCALARCQSCPFYTRINRIHEYISYSPSLESITTIWTTRVTFQQWLRAIRHPRHSCSRQSQLVHRPGQTWRRRSNLWFPQRRSRAAHTHKYTWVHQQTIANYCPNNIVTKKSNSSRIQVVTLTLPK